MGRETFLKEWVKPSLLPGQYLMPAFNDGHMHFSIAVRRFGVADLNFIPDADATVEDAVKEIQHRVKEFADAHQRQDRIQYQRYNQLRY